MLLLSGLPGAVIMIIQVASEKESLSMTELMNIESILSGLSHIALTDSLQKVICRSITIFCWKIKMLRSYNSFEEGHISGFIALSFY